MPENPVALAILLVLLPGFCAAYVIQHLSVRRKQTELDKIIEALLFSTILFVLTLPHFKYVLPVSWHPVNTSNGTIYTLEFNAKYLQTLLFWAIGIGVLYAININRDLFLKLFRKFKLTDRTARSSIWNDVFQDIPNSYLQVELSDGRIVVGYLHYYSDDAEESSIFLEDAAWLTETGEQISIDGPGILLTKEAKIVFISFLNPDISKELPSWWRRLLNKFPAKS
jgi:hypothetical protein